VNRAARQRATAAWEHERRRRIARRVALNFVVALAVPLAVVAALLLFAGMS
jgi:uncharacterized BrkB/YihY/UPF0761 family membrane protein